MLASVWLYACASVTAQRARQAARIGDQAEPSSLGNEVDQCVDFGPHAALVKLSLGAVTTRFRKRHAVDPALSRPVEVQRHLFDAGQQHERIGAEAARKQA